MMRFSLLLMTSAACALILGCAPAVQVPEQVRIEVAVRCVDPAKIPPRPPVRSESDLLAMDRFRRTLAVWQDMRRWEAHAEQLAALVAGCAALPPG